MNHIRIKVMIKDGGYRDLVIPKSFLEKLAESIQTQGFEYLTLLSGVIQVVGFMVTGKQVGERLIVINSKATDAIESNEPPITAEAE